MNKLLFDSLTLNSLGLLLGLSSVDHPSLEKTESCEEIWILL